MLRVTAQYEQVTQEGKACADCRKNPHTYGHHFTLVPSQFQHHGGTYFYAPDPTRLSNNYELYADYLCDACFLRRRLEGRV